MASISSATGQNNFGHGPLLTAMIGNQSIVISLPINEIQVTTEKDLDNQIKEAIGGDKEAGHIVQVRIDYSLKKPIVLVLKCLGVSDAVDCGTFGTPRSIDPLVYVLKNTFENALVSFVSGKSYFNPPYNEKGTKFAMPSRLDLEYCRPNASSMTFSKHSASERNALCRLDFPLATGRLHCCRTKK